MVVPFNLEVQTVDDLILILFGVFSVFSRCLCRLMCCILNKFKKLETQVQEEKSCRFQFWFPDQAENTKLTRQREVKFLIIYSASVTDKQI